MIRLDARVSNIGAFHTRLDAPHIQAAAARGLNEHVRLQERQAVRLLSSQTKIPSSRVASVTKPNFAAPSGNMQASVDVQDSAIPLGKETSRSWSRSSVGATAGDWRNFTYKGTFIVPRYGGAIFVRRPGAKKYPIIRVWGPVLPNELRRPTQPTLPAAERFAATDLEARVLRHVINAIGS